MTGASEPEVVIVGAGAAGIGAGLVLKRLGVPFVILEAKDRVGGRAHTDVTSLGHLWDRGCHWFHSADRNPLRAIADRLGHRYHPVQRGATAPLFRAGRWQMEARERLKVWEFLDRVATAGKDVAASAFLEAGDPLGPLLRHWMKLMTSAEPEEVSALDYGRYDDSHVNLPVRDGYGALLVRLARALPIELATPVTWIAAAGRRLRVETPRGILAAGAVIVTASVNALLSGGIRFGPRLPAGFTDALAAVPCGFYEKIAVAVEEATFAGFDPPFCDIVDPSGSEPLNLEIAPFGRPIAIGHVAGHHARDLARAGDGACVDFLTEKLVVGFGGAIRNKIMAAAVTSWGADPFIRGGYATALPGRAAARQRLIEADLAPLHFSGEALHSDFNATAHGAFLSGQAAAMKAARDLGCASGEADPAWLPPAVLGH